MTGAPVRMTKSVSGEGRRPSRRRPFRRGVPEDHRRDQQESYGGERPEGVVRDEAAGAGDEDDGDDVQAVCRERHGPQRAEGQQRPAQRTAQQQAQGDHREGEAAGTQDLGGTAAVRVDGEDRADHGAERIRRGERLGVALPAGRRHHVVRDERRRRALAPGGRARRGDDRFRPAQPRARAEGTQTVADRGEDHADDEGDDGRAQLLHPEPAQGHAAQHESQPHGDRIGAVENEPDARAERLQRHRAEQSEQRRAGEGEDGGAEKQLPGPPPQHGDDRDVEQAVEGEDHGDRRVEELQGEADHEDHRAAAHEVEADAREAFPLRQHVAPGHEGDGDAGEQREEDRRAAVHEVGPRGRVAPLERLRHADVGTGHAEDRQTPRDVETEDARRPPEITEPAHGTESSHHPMIVCGDRGDPGVHPGIRWRAMSSPVISYPPELPVSAARDEIADAIRDHQVVIVAGATGSGKTTQLPKIALELGRERIAHTQPRRLAARTIAERVAEELRVELGTLVGYKVRFTDKVSDETRIALMTDGILLNEIHRDRLLTRYDTIIIDEAHERSLNVDFLLGYLARILPERPDLKVIITSATIDPESFARHFAAADGTPAPVIEVSGRTYPVEIRYRPLVDEDAEQDAAGEPEDEVSAIVAALRELDREAPGDVLVFLPGEAEIRDAADAVRAAYAKDRSPTEVLPLFGRLSAAEQHRVFERSTVAGVRRRVVLATNVAETSLTVPGIKYVIDTGTARISRYSNRSK
ncbi:unnamed protein product, partial [Penicillium discolor]